MLTDLFVVPSRFALFRSMLCWVLPTTSVQWFLCQRCLQWLLRDHSSPRLSKQSMLRSGLSTLTLAWLQTSTLSLSGWCGSAANKARTTRTFCSSPTAKPTCTTTWASTTTRENSSAIYCWYRTMWEGSLRVAVDMLSFSTKCPKLSSAHLIDLETTRHDTTRSNCTVMSTHKHLN